MPKRVNCINRSCNLACSVLFQLKKSYVTEILMYVWWALSEATLSMVTSNEHVLQ